jgi:hypothetical protein
MSLIAKFFTFIFATVLLNQTNVQAQSLDWSTLNSTLQDLVQDHIDNYEFIEGGYVRFDESKSDLTKGSLDMSFEFNSTELNLLSSRTPQKIDLSGQLLVNTTDIGPLKKIDFTVGLNLKGETLLILKHINELFADCETVDPADLFKSELCSYIQLTTNANNAEDLQPAMESLRNALLQLFPSLTNDDEFKKLLTNMNIVKHNGTTLLSTVVNNLDLFGLNISGEISLVFSDNDTQLTITGSALLSSSDYDAYLKSLEGFLVNLQNKDIDTTSKVTGYTSFVFDLLEGIFL